MSEKKVSVRFYNDREVRAIWDDKNGKWWFSVVDVVAAMSLSSNPANYWYVLKSRLKKTGNQTLTKCKGLRLTAPDGSRRLTDRIADREMFMKGIDCSYYYEDGSAEEK